MSTTIEEHSCRVDDRMHVFLSVLPYALMAVTLPVALATGPSIGNTPTDTVVILTLSAVMMVWVWWWTTAHPRWFDDELKMGIYYSVRTLLVFVLTWINPFFAFFAWLGFIEAAGFFRLSRAWIAIAATAAIVAGAQIGGMPPDGKQGWVVYGALFLVNFILAGGFTYYETHRQADTERRRDAITELEQTNERLQSALAENAGLQVQLCFRHVKPVSSTSVSGSRARSMTRSRKVSPGS